MIRAAGLAELLAAEYGETLRADGIRSSTTLMEVYASEVTGSWTIVISNTDGVSCVIATGLAWEAYPAPVAGVPG